MSKNSLTYNIKLKYYDNRETKLYAFDTLLDMGELAESIQKKMQPKYDAVYGKVLLILVLPEMIFILFHSLGNVTSNYLKRN